MRWSTAELRAKLSEEEYRRHPDVELLAAVQRAVTDIIPADPKAAEFRLRDDLGNFRRLKKRGGPATTRIDVQRPGCQRSRRPGLRGELGSLGQGQPQPGPPEGTPAALSPRATSRPGAMLTTVLTKVVQLRPDVVEGMTEAEAAAAWHAYLDRVKP